MSLICKDSKAENKLEKIMEKVDEVILNRQENEEHPYLGDVFDELRQITFTERKR
jgi:hypothetical protein